MTRFIIFIALIVLLVNAEEDMSADSVSKLKEGKILSAKKEWSCDKIIKEMKKKGKTVVDCIMRDGNPWFRIDDA